MFSPIGRELEVIKEEKREEILCGEYREMTVDNDVQSIQVSLLDNDATCWEYGRRRRRSSSLNLIFMRHMIGLR